MSATDNIKSAVIKHPEHEFIVLTVQPHSGTENLPRLTELAAGNLDWDYIRETADRHGVLGLLYQTLKGTSGDIVPKSVFEKIKSLYFAYAVRNSVLTKELLRLITLLDGYGIEAIPYKGPVQATAYYGDTTMRQFEDLDILVHVEDVLAAKNILIADEYSQSYGLNEEQTVVCLASQFHYPVLVKDLGDVKCYVELHWDIAPKYYFLNFDPRNFWKNLRVVELDGVRIRDLSPVNVLFVLYLHGYRHRWSRLDWISGVAQLVNRQEQIDWESVLDTAVRLGTERMLLLSLLLARDILGAQLPDIIGDATDSTPAVSRMARIVAKHLFDPPGAKIGVIERFMYHYRARKHLSDKIRVAFGRLMIPKKEKWIYPPLSPPLAALYYLLRPFWDIYERRKGIGLPETPS